MSYPHQSGRSSVAVVVIPVKGCERSLPAFVKLEGFIDKRSDKGRQRMAELYRSTLLFFMPSIAEAFGVVFCEANVDKGNSACL